MLTALHQMTPPAVLRWLLARLGLTEGVHAWMCDTGLCPCGIDFDLDAEEAVAA